MLKKKTNWGNVVVIACGVMLGLLLLGIANMGLITIMIEDLCYQPADLPHQAVRYDMVFPPEELEGKGQGYYFTGGIYASACEHDFNLAQLLFYKVFPKTKQEWDKKKRQELAELVIKSHQREIRVALDNDELNVWLEKKIVDENNQPVTYIYGTENDYVVEIDGDMGYIKSLVANSWRSYTKTERLTPEELEAFAVEIIKRTHGGWFYEHEWNYSTGQKIIDDNNTNTFFRWESKTGRTLRQVGLDVNGNIVSYTEGERE